LLPWIFYTKKDFLSVTTRIYSFQGALIEYIIAENVKKGKKNFEKKIIKKQEGGDVSN